MARFQVQRGSSLVSLALLAALVLPASLLFILQGSGRVMYICQDNAAARQHLRSDPLLKAYGQLQRGDADTVLNRRPELVAAFEAAPWLLPPRSPALPWAGVHTLEDLLPLRAKRKGAQEKAISFLLFDKNSAAMIMNCVYTMVKFGSVDNYIVGYWRQRDQDSCRDLNLPCADVSSFMAELRPGTGESSDDTAPFGTKDYCAITWIKPLVVRALLDMGYAVHCTDTDIGYGPHPVWESYLRFMEDGAADGAFMGESPVNTGNYVLLPTPRVQAVAAAWAARAATAFPAEGHCDNDQVGMAELHGKAYKVCNYVQSCRTIQKAELEGGGGEELALFRVFPTAAAIYAAPGEFAANCGFANLQSWTPANIDPCHWSALFVHPICNGHVDKELSLRKAGFWFMDGDVGCPKDNATGAERCTPRVLSQPDAESAFMQCGGATLALTFPGAALPGPQNNRRALRGRE